MKEIPSDFDWITERKKCSPLAVFDALRQDAIRNMEAFHAGEQQRSAWDFVSTQPETFGVYGHIDRFKQAGVRFMLLGDEIEVEGQNVDNKNDRDIDPERSRTVPGNCGRRRRRNAR